MTTDTAAGSGATLQTTVMTGGAFSSPASGGFYLLNGTFMTKASTLALVSSPIFYLYGPTTTFNVERQVANVSDLQIDSVIQHYNGSSPAVLTKTGAGVLRLNGANTYADGTAINAGTIVLGPSGTLGNVGAIGIANGATLDVRPYGASGYTLAAGRTLTNAGSILGVLNVSGSFLGNGLVGGLLVNSGGVVSSSSGTLTLSGAVTNNGTLRLTGGAVLNAAGATSFVNNGILDLMTADASSTLPANFVNGTTGVVLTASLVRVKTATRTLNADGMTSTVNVTIDGYTGHTYTLQRASGLDGGAGGFTNVTPLQTATGTGTGTGVPRPSPTPARPQTRASIG